MKLLKRFNCIALVLAMLWMLQPGTAQAAYANTYVNTGNHRQDILGVARTQVGYTEGMDNANKYGAWYQLNNEPWCAIFVSWCARKAGIPTSVLRSSSIASPNAEVGGKTNFGIPHYDGKEYTPIPGDLFFTRDFSHVGLVFHVDGDYFYTLEGNSNAAGSDNGDRVVCNRRKVSDFFYGVPAYDTAPAVPQAPVITTDRTDYRQGENDQGDTVNLSWTGSADDVKRTMTVYYKGDKYLEQEFTPGVTSCTLENLMAGGYLVSITSEKADGSYSFGQCPVTVADPYTLTLRYHTAGGSISPNPKYQVVIDVLSMRAGPDPSTTRLRMIKKDAVLTVTQTRQGTSFLWGKTQDGGVTGWIALSDKYVRQIGYYADETGLIHAHSRRETANSLWEYGKSYPSGLRDDTEFELAREHHTFCGWSMDPEGGGTLYKANDGKLTTGSFDPDFRYEDKTIDLYAVWQKNVASVAIATKPVKVSYYTGEPLDLTGLSLNVTYTDGTTATVTDGFTAGAFNADSLGTKTVTVSYRNATASFPVTVVNRLRYTASDSGASALKNVYYTGSKDQWKAIAIGKGNDPLLSANIQFGYQILGDIDSTRTVDETDAIYLLQHVLFPDYYPTTAYLDMNRDGVVNEDDAIYLLQHILFPDVYPLGS